MAPRALCTKYGPLPPTVTVNTAKGLHIYLKTGGEPIKTSVAKLGPGIDVCGGGGYAVGADSIHPTGHIYRYADGRDPGSIRVAQAPKWLLQLVRKPNLPKPVKAAADPKAAKSERDIAYGKAALDGELRRLAGTPLHQRNTTLNQCAFRLGQPCANGYLSETEVIARLRQTATEIGLEAGEIERTITSDLEAGKRFPCRKSPPRKEPIPHRADGSQGNPVTAALAKLGCTDSDNAERFVKRYGKKFAHCPELGWRYFDGRRWTSDIDKKRALAAMDSVWRHIRLRR